MLFIQLYGSWHIPDIEKSTEENPRSLCNVSQVFPTPTLTWNGNVPGGFMQTQNARWTSNSTPMSNGTGQHWHTLPEHAHDYERPAALTLQAAPHTHLRPAGLCANCMDIEKNVEKFRATAEAIPPKSSEPSGAGLFRTARRFIEDMTDPRADEPDKSDTPIVR